MNNEIIKKANVNKTIEIYTENTVFQISTLEEQKNKENDRTSTIDIGECEDKLRDYYHIPDYYELLIFKVDIKQDCTTYVQYEVYNPIDLDKLDLTICEGIQISIDLPVKMAKDIEILYESLDESGYNLFDLNNTFYNDICAKYTTINGTDMTLNDRKQDIYSKTANLSFCQIGCTFQSFNSTNRKAKCYCETNNKDI